jgi:hypothetical protein
MGYTPAIHSSPAGRHFLFRKKEWRTAWPVVASYDLGVVPFSIEGKAAEEVHPDYFE